jgi:general secretion pathway protein J
MKETDRGCVPPVDRAGAAGFTLLELLLAMSALAMVAAICYGAFHLGIRAVERGEVAVVTAQRLRAASDVLIRQIKSAVVYPARNREEDIFPYFVGTATSMTFITAAGLSGGGGLTRVVYQVVDEPPRLVLQESKFFSPDALGREPLDKPGDQAAVVLDGFRSIKFQYMMNDGVDTDWLDEWNGQDEEALPAAVRILVEGLAGMEVDTWGQEIPVMVALYGENLGEMEESYPIDAMEDDGEDDGDEDTPPPPGGIRQSPPGGRDNDADGGDDE